MDTVRAGKKESAPVAENKFVASSSTGPRSGPRMFYSDGGQWASIYGTRWKVARGERGWKVADSGLKPFNWGSVRAKSPYFNLCLSFALFSIKLFKLKRKKDTHVRMHFEMRPSSTAKLIGRFKVIVINGDNSVQQ